MLLFFWVQYHDGAIVGLDCLAARDVAEGKKERLEGLPIAGGCWVSAALVGGRLDRATSCGPHSLLVATLGVEFLLRIG